MNPIKEARQKAGLTQKQLATLTGIPKRTIEDWEGGRRKCPDYVTDMVLGKIKQKNILDNVVAMLEAVETADDVLDIIEYIKKEG